MYQDRYTKTPQSVKLNESVGIKDLLSNEGTFLQIDTTEDAEIYDETDDVDYDEDVTEELVPASHEFSFQELRFMMTEISDGIYKRAIKPGEGDVVFSKAKVTISYSAYWEKEKHPFDSTSKRDNKETFILGERVLKGLQIAIGTMRKGETSEFILPFSLLYGELGCFQRIKPKADGLFVIKLIDFSDPGDPMALQNMDDGDKQNFTMLKPKTEEVDKSAKEFFKTGAVNQAIRTYHEIISSLSFCNIDDANEQEECDKFKYKTYCNLAVCYNKKSEPKKVLSMCEEIRKLGNFEPNAKIMFQEARALIALADFDKSRILLEKAVKLEPDNSIILNELNDLQKKVDEYKKCSTSIWRKAFNMQKQPAEQKEEDKTKKATSSSQFRELIDEMCNKLMASKIRSMDLIPDLAPEDIRIIEDVIKDKKNIILNKQPLLNSMNYSLKRIN